MSNGLFVTGTGTDVGKTYVSALIIKSLRENRINCGYYKAAASGAKTIGESDAGYVNRVAGIGQDKKLLISYLYKTSASPHLAARIEGNPVELSKILEDYTKVSNSFDYVLTEGSGGIVCPIRFDQEQSIMLEDIVTALDIPVLVVAGSGLGTINSTVLTIEYLKLKGIKISGIMLNCFDGSLMHSDNLQMIEKLTGIEVIATVKKGDKSLNVDIKRLQSLFV